MVVDRATSVRIDMHFSIAAFFPIVKSVRRRRWIALKNATSAKRVSDVSDAVVTKTHSAAWSRSIHSNPARQLPNITRRCIPPCAASFSIVMHGLSSSTQIDAHIYAEFHEYASTLNAARTTRVATRHLSVHTRRACSRAHRRSSQQAQRLTSQDDSPTSCQEKR